MPAPVAKGIIIGVSVLVAAGIAVYESPQFQRWVRNSRRKIATALHHLGDEISPSEASILQDISMTEDPGAAAAERRNKAREELLQRRQLLENRRRSIQSGDAIKGSSGSSTAATSFDSLVDGDGRLRSETVQGDDKDEAVHATTSARSTAIDTDDIATEMVQRRRIMQPAPADDLLYERRQSQEALGQLHPGLAIPPPFSDVSSHHPSESLVDLTPTSEFPEAADFGGASTASSAARSPQGQTEPREYFSIAPLPVETQNQTEGRPSEYYYARPSESGVQSPVFSNIEEISQNGDVSTASSVFGSTSHTQEDAFSDGTPSEWEHESGGVATPASWSEVGSVLSSDDGHHQ